MLDGLPTSVRSVTMVGRPVPLTASTSERIRQLLMNKGADRRAQCHVHDRPGGALGDGYTAWVSRWSAVEQGLASRSQPAV